MTWCLITPTRHLTLAFHPALFSLNPKIYQDKSRGVACPWAGVMANAVSDNLKQPEIFCYGAKRGLVAANNYCFGARIYKSPVLVCANSLRQDLQYI